MCYVLCYDMLLYVIICFRGWSNTVGNLNEGFRVTKDIHRVLFDLFLLGGRI